jgi:hypothetical protein
MAVRSNAIPNNSSHADTLIALLRVLRVRIHSNPRQ